MRATLWMVVTLVLVAPQPAHADTKWTTLQSEHFAFVGDAAERDIRQIALHLEQFRDALSRALPPAAVASSIPTTVYVFQNDKSFTPYKPRFEGRPVAVAGFFLGRADRNVIAINAEFEESALRIVFHEYSHFLVQNTAGRLPPWANEGLAGFYETFEQRDGGKGAMIGLPNRDHVNLLRESMGMPLRDLLAIDYSSSAYNEGNRRGLFYAESWALIHYLMLGNPTRAPQLSKYLVSLQTGTDPDQGFNAAFGDVAILERELRDYVRKFTFPAIRFNFGEKASGIGVESGQRLDDVEASAYLADLLARAGRTDEARAQLQKLLDANSKSSRAAAALGRLEINEGNLDAALPWLERAALEDPTDGASQAIFGRALLARYEEPGGDGSQAATLEKARGALARAASISPDDAETLATLAHVEGVIGMDGAHSLALLERAATLAPGEDRYRLMLAEELARQGQYTRATSYLGPLVARSKREDIRERARRHLANIANRPDAPSGNRAAVDSPNPSTGTRAPASRLPNSGGGFVPEFRQPRPDETRVLGTFSAVTCQSGSVILHIETEDESLKLAAATFADVEFISYRATSPGAVNCGPVEPPSRVLATYRESDSAVRATGIDGRAVAIELLPEGYVPR